MSNPDRKQTFDKQYHERFQQLIRRYQSVSERPSTDRRDRMAEMKNLMKNYAKTPAFAKSAPQAVPQSKDISIFKVGMSVEHSRFGQGKIISIIGEKCENRISGVGS